MIRNSLKLLPTSRVAACNHSTISNVKTRLGIVGVPFCKGQPREGVDLAPNALRKQGLLKCLQDASYGNLLINDYGNLNYVLETGENDVRQNMRNYDDFIACNKALIQKVQHCLEENDQFLTLGGDHSIGFGSVAGHLMHTPNLSLVWVDAHADINLPSTSGSGNIHGMPVSLLIKELRPFWKSAHLDKIAPRCLPTEDIIYIGLRDIDPYEAYILNKLNIRSYPMDGSFYTGQAISFSSFDQNRVIDKVGFAKVIEMTLDSLKSRNKIHISFDIDALDISVAPSTGTSVYGGLTLREGIFLVESLRDTDQLQGIDLVEVNPLIGTAEDIKKTIESSFEILKATFGYKRGGYFTNINEHLLNMQS